MAVRKRNGAKVAKRARGAGRGGRARPGKGTARELTLEQLVDRLIGDQAAVAAAQKALKATLELVKNHGHPVGVLREAIKLAVKTADERKKAIVARRDQADLFERYFDELVELDIAGMVGEITQAATRRILGDTPLEAAVDAATAGDQAPPATPATLQ